MNCNKQKIMRIIFYISFSPMLAVIIISIYFSVVGHDYYDWFEPDKIAYTAHGLEEFFNSMLFYGGYLTIHIPVLEFCVYYQIYYLFIKKKTKL